jgi:hypothetical protein
MPKILRYIAIILAVELIVSLGAFVTVQAANVFCSPTSGPPGSAVSVNGTGFAQSGSVDVYYEQSYLTSVNTSASGSFNTSISVPDSSAGSHEIFAQDNEGNSESTFFTITPKITLSRSSGTPGTTVSVTGKGFAGNSYSISIMFDSTSVNSGISSDSNGNFSGSFSVPSATAGNHSVTASDSQSNISPGVNFNVEVVTTLAINKTSGTIGTSVTVSGGGFGPNESGIAVTIGTSQVGGSVTANASGSWSTTFSIPPMPGGSYTIDASGPTTLASNVPNVSFTVTPFFSISTSSGTAGTSVTATGTGFGSNESITVTFDGSAIGPTVSADSNGSWTDTFTIPVSSGGSHKISAGGPSTPASSVAAANFTVGSGLSINKNSGPVGTSVTVSGSGFAANESGISITFDGNTLGSTTQANATGIWSATVVIPNSAGGPHTIGAHGKTTTGSDQTFSVTPSLSSLSKTSGPAGTSAVLSGSGFAANENITILYDGTAIDSSVSADTNGSWSDNITIPPSSAGNHAIKVKGSVSGDVSASGLNFKVTVSMSINPTTGFVGGTVNISGSGFAANSSLQITYDDTPLNIGSATTDNAGNFNKSITIPKSKAGPHTIGVTDAQNNKSDAIFVMDSTPPPVPNLAAPADGETIGFTGSITPTLRWSAVSDPSGVAYNLQIDTDPDFPHPVLQKTDITGTRYTLSQSEALPQGKYYWRVQAIDGASNVSDWSEPYLLKSGVMSQSTFILIIIAGIVVVGLIIYFVGVRLILRRRKGQPVPEGVPAPEIIIPEVVNAEYRTIEQQEDAGRRRALPWRLALPQAPQQTKGSKTLSSEDQARLKVIIDFAKSLPLVEPGYNTDWLIALAESSTGTSASPALYSQILNGEIQVQYEPAWMRHPTFLDLQTLLEGQPLLQDLNSFVESVNQTASEVTLLLQDIYKDINAEITWDILNNGGWGFVSAIYVDALSWFQGKNLREPSDRDYIIKSEGAPDAGNNLFGLYAEQTTSFAGLLMRSADENEAIQLRTLHLKLRRTYRNNDKASEMVGILTQIEVQRTRIIDAFSQFSRLNP